MGVGAREASRIVLVNPPSAPGTTANREGAAGLGYVDPVPDGFCYPPQTIATTASVLREEGWSVQIVDAVAESLTTAEALDRLALDQVDVLAVMVSADTLGADLAFLDALRTAAPSHPIIVFGPATRYARQELSQAPIDAILLGEPEWALGIACRSLGSGERSGLPAVYTPSDLGAPGYDDQGFLGDLDRLPLPAWDLLPVERYRSLTVASSRGCGDACRYCPYVAAQGHVFRGRSAESVADEMACLESRFHPERIVFRDPVFAYDRERVVGICQGMLARRLRTPWECESRPEHLDEELLRLMRQAGCEWIKVGVESASARLLADLGRIPSASGAHAYREHCRRIVQASKALGMRCRLFVMTGLPGETAQDLRETLEFVRRLEPTALNIKRFQAYPGIRLAEDEIATAEAPDPELVAAFQSLRERYDLRSRPRASLASRARRWLSRRLKAGRP